MARKHSNSSRQKVTPGSDIRFEEEFDFAFLSDEDSVDFLNKHGRIMFIVRGLSGTGKSTLTAMVSSKYPSGTKCSAVDYFSEPFTSHPKSRENFPKSHEYCLKKVKDACQDNQHPIIVQNTNVRKWEMQPYIDLALEHGYTVIMAITVRKVSLNPKVLEKTNTQGLKSDYFRKRIGQWEEVVPQYTGWFLNPADAAFILRQTEVSFSSIQEDFLSCFSTPPGDPVDYFNWENQLFCIARCCNDSLVGYEGLEYYLSREVQAAYGKSYKLVILGFVVSESQLLALVELPKDVEDLVEKKVTESMPEDDLLDLSRLQISEDLDKLSCKDFACNSEETVLLTDWGVDEAICIDSCSFMLLASVKQNPPPRSIHGLKQNLFAGIADSKGNVSVKNFNKLENGTSFCKLGDEQWFILSYKKMSVDSVFTGLYK